MRGKRKPKRGRIKKIKWSQHDRQAFTDQKLRAQTIPPKPKPKPERREWDAGSDT